MAKKKILIVEDEPEIVKVVTIRLEYQGYEVINARDATQGLTFAQWKKPDLIILDVSMPVADGFSVCESLKSSELTASIPVIFLTAKDRPEDEKRAYELGAKAYIKKPYEASVLLDEIKKALEA
ncbi:MAG: response regulator [Thermodesulfobacteriota bacterium]